MNQISDFFKDKKGKIVLAQVPNAPLIGWLIFTILNFILANNQSKANYLFSLLSFGFIFTWAWLEITSGVNYFRRALGLIVLMLALWFKM